MSENQVIKPFSRQGQFTAVDNLVFDILMPKLTGTEFKILCFIIRKTIGWQKEMDGLSYSQIRKGTGIGSNTTVQNGTKKLSDLDITLVFKTNQKNDAFLYKLNPDFEIAIPKTVKQGVPKTVTRAIPKTVNTKEREDKENNKDDSLSSKSKKTKAFNQFREEVLNAWTDEFGKDIEIDDFSFKKKPCPSEKNKVVTSNLKYWFEQAKPKLGDDDRFVSIWRDALAVASKNHGLRAASWFNLGFLTGRGKSGRDAGYWRIYAGDFDFLHDKFLQSNKPKETAVAQLTEDGGFQL